MSGEPLAALITGELTGWVGEMCIFSCGEEKGDQVEEIICENFLSSLLNSAGSWVLNLQNFKMRESKRELLGGLMQEEENG